jgi:hypothetical protein
MTEKGMDSIAMQMNIRNNTMEMQEAIKDLYKWESEMHKKEEQMKKSKGSQRTTEAPPIRGKAPAVRHVCDTEMNKPAPALRQGMQFLFG